MRALVLTSNGLRHQYFLKVISENFDLVGVVHEDKGEYYDSQKEKSRIVQTHFEKLSQTEEEFFLNKVQNLVLDYTQVRQMNRNQINEKNVVNWAKKQEPDVIFLFGTGILKDGWFNAFENKIINLHLGLSPFYRGSATLFWPFANDELECLGATIHIAAPKVDAGDILERVKPNIETHDNYYTINYKIIKCAIQELPSIARRFYNGDISLVKQDITESNVYKKSDFNKKVLLKVIKKYGNNIPIKELNRMKESNKCTC